MSLSGLLSRGIFYAVVCSSSFPPSFNGIEPAVLHSCAVLTLCLRTRLTKKKKRTQKNKTRTSSRGWPRRPRGQLQFSISITRGRMTTKQWGTELQVGTVFRKRLHAWSLVFPSPRGRCSRTALAIGILRANKTRSSSEVVMNISRGQMRGAAGAAPAGRVLSGPTFRTERPPRFSLRAEGGGPVGLRLACPLARIQSPRKRV